jgi:hypothetical protein
MSAMALTGPDLPVPVTVPGATVASVPSADPVLAAAGDIACPTTAPQFHAAMLGGVGGICQMRSTSDLLLALHPTAVATLGDNQYDNATLAQFNASFDPTWGRLKAETHPAIGNHEVETDRKATGYFQYFGAAAGDPTKGWYSYDLGTWHVIVLNSNCLLIGGCGPGSPEEQWLSSDLAAHPNLCTLAYWHHPRWTSGEHGNNPILDTIWQDLYGAGVDVVLNGHDHDYERFAPQDPWGRLDTARGVREFVSGTGGSRFETLATRQPNSEALSQTFGVLALTLHPGSYDWRFVPQPGKTFTDSGTTACH